MGVQYQPKAAQPIQSHLLHVLYAVQLTATAAALLLFVAGLLSGPLASSGTLAGAEMPVLTDNQMAVQPAAFILGQDQSDATMVAVNTPVPTTRVKALRMAAATAAAERRAAAAHMSAVAAATAAAADATDGSAATNDTVPDAFQAGPTYQAILDKHNSYRARHQAVALTWSSTLASQAASYAANCNFAHDPYANAGENLFAISDSSNPAGALVQAIDLW
jgi:hypothetical protein